MSVLFDYKFEDGNDCLFAKAEKLCTGDRMYLEKNTVIANKRITLTCDIAKGTVIRFGNGETEYSASYVELDEKSIRVYSHFSAPDLALEKEHGADVQGKLCAVIDQKCGSADVRLLTPSGAFRYDNIAWSGRAGNPFVSVVSGRIDNAVLRMTCIDYGKPIYAFGDSYFNTSSPSRWTSYLYKDGYKNFCLFGFPGMGSKDGIEQFKTALTHGTPKYVFWCMGMNDPDRGSEINEVWHKAVEELLIICREKGIIPVLSTIPDVPERSNAAKNAYTRASGCRIVDFQAAVQVYGTQNWHDGMLFTDKVHPSEAGAKALYIQAIADFPELMN